MEDPHEDISGASPGGTIQLIGYQLARDRARRNVRQPVRFSHADVASYAFAIATEEEFSDPLTYEEAMNSVHKDKWFVGNWNG